MVGKKLSHYEIIEQLGEGGMGVVYKARDLNLDRLVAIKVLPPEKIADADRKRRFVQEAKAASALNHPNIVTIYDIASEHGRDFIAMEYVQGKALNQTIGRKGLPLSDVLKYAVQIADALSAAHAAGIIHRDLKPGNVMLSSAQDRPICVKVLDFGLAKLVGKFDSGDQDRTQSTQDDAPISGEGVVLGTAAYMSPEQAEGKTVDVRSDIFSFGALLYEMVTGLRAFQGDSRLSTLTAVLREEPKPVTQIVEGLPPELERIITRCLRKDPERRFQTMADLGVALREVKEESESGSLKTAMAQTSRLARPMVWLLLGLTALILGAGALWLAHAPANSPEPAWNPVPLATYPGFLSMPSFSPEGNQVAFVWNGEKQDNIDIYVKLIGTNGPPLRLTTDAAQDYGPAWSPDGRFIAFLRILPSGKRAILLIPAIGGPERKIAEVFSETRPAWSPDGKWLVISERASEKKPFSLSLLSVETSELRRLTFPPKQSFGDIHVAFSGDGRSLAFSRGINADSNGPSNLFVLSLSQALQPDGEPRQITYDSEYADFPAWTADGRDIVYSVGWAVSPKGLWRIPVSAHTGIRAEPHQLLSLSNDAYEPAISRNGHRFAYIHAFSHVSILSVGTHGVEGNGARSDRQSKRLIWSTRDDQSPNFSPDGSKVVFLSTRSGNGEIWVCNADGSNAVQLTSFAGPAISTPRWSPDGARIAFDSDAAGEWDIYVIGANGGKAERVTTDPANDGNPSWSHDSQWIYFDSARTGQQQLWKVPANGGQAIQITQQGGFAPIESRDGKSLYYVKSLDASSLWRVSLETGEVSEVLQDLSEYQNFAIAPGGIYFVPLQTSTEDQSIKFLSFATKHITTVASLEKAQAWGLAGSTVWGLALSPDGKWLLYGREQQVGSELMLVEDFH